ncbi:complement C3-like [Dendropsophus ebraccatus]|uniref:complement C3-like n=1 Tax=Dendropsophus ebraccatus TaxID=150705 RepID=UPI0038313F01
MGCRALCLILLYGLIGTYAQPQCSLITPSVLRVDSEETIVVDGHGSAFDADITIQDFPQKKLTLVTSRVSVNGNNHYFGDVKLTIPSKDLEKDPNKKQFVYVSVKSSVCNLEKVVLLSYHSGYILIQTDKPIYTPGSTVQYRIFTMTPNLKPVSKPVVVEFLTPDNIMVKRTVAKHNGKTGIISLSHRLPDLVSLGLWTMSVKFEDNLMQSYTTQFEVKEYVLPSFEIKISTMKKFFHINDEELRMDIEARYLNGKPVNGKAFVLSGVKKDSEKKSLPDTLRRVEISDGEGSTVMMRRDLIKYFKNERDLLEWRIFVSVTVITESGSEMVESVLDDIPIAASPYKILYTKTPNFFKPGTPFDLMVLVTYPDGSPAHRIPVAAEPGNVRGRTLEDGTVRLTLNTRSDISQLQITVSTQDDKLTKDQQASATMVASAYRPIGGNYLHLSVVGGKLKPGDSAVINFFILNSHPAVADQINQFNYVIMNKGRIMKVGTQARGRDQTIGAMYLPITEEFIPSVRMLAYYTVTTGAGREIVADSRRIDVAENYMGTVEITGERFIDNAIQQPGDSMRLKLQADHMAAVALVAVDKGLYMNNDKLKISQKKVWDSVEKYDIGCTPGSGADTPGVFYDAGLALETTFKVTTPQRSEPLCHPKLKHRRRSSEDDEYIPDEEIISRTDFLESWLWRVEIMNERPDARGISTKILPVSLKDSMTTWEVSAVSLSESKGIYVSKPYNIRVMKDFFIDLKLPYSVVRNEQVEIRAILHNYGSNQRKMQVDWTNNDQLCSLSTAKKKYRQEVIIQPSSSRAVPFIIVPLSLGEHEIEVKVKAHGEFVSDGVKKKLKVVPEGRLVTQVLKSVVLDPEGKGGVQEELISVVYPKNTVPKTDVVTIVTIQGSLISEMVEKFIDGVNLNNLIIAPGGSAEQNIMRMTASLIAAHYLDVSNQWYRVGVQRREEAIQYIKSGLYNQLPFMNSEGSYGGYGGKSPSSTWLTAYVVKVFSLASSLIDVKNYLICKSVKDLIVNKQNPDGQFREEAYVSSPGMAGGITKDSADLDSTLTAFVLISMLTSKETCAEDIGSIQQASIERAIQYIKNHYEALNKPYSIAITSYALAKAGRLNDIRKLMAASTDNTHWDEPSSRFVSIEATSYALLTLLTMKEFEKAAPLVQWLTEQRYYGVVWGSTQATMMQFEAVAQYLIDVPNVNDLDMIVTFKLPGRSQNTTHRLHLQNALLARSEETSQIGDFTVTAGGKGRGSLTVSSVYYTLGTEEKKCNNFDLSVTIKDEPQARRPEEAISTVSMTICTRFLKNHDSTMSVIDISMMTGFKPDIDDLNRLKKGADRYVSNFEINRDAFDKGRLILYIDRISHKEEDCLKFNLLQYFAVGLIQPGSVTVYDYYSPENRCTKFYHVEEGSKLLGQICKGEVCRCAEENCFMQQKLEEVSSRIRFSKACESEVDYVYKTTLTAIQKADNYDTYVMTIKTVLKHGTDEISSEQKREFISHAKCRTALDLKIGQDYVIWGVTKDLWNTDTASGYSYMITRDTWIEMWPSDRECQKPENSYLCEDLFQFVDELEIRGCN